MDELAQYLNTRYRKFFTGITDRNIVIWKKMSPTRPNFTTFTIGLPYNPLKIEEEEWRAMLKTAYKTEPCIKAILEFGEKLSNANNMPFIVILYPTIPEYRNNNWNDSEKVYPFNKTKFVFLRKPHSSNKYECRI